MLIYFIAQGLPTDPPTSFLALQWVMVGMLSGALVYVFRQWQIEKRNCVNRYLDTIDKLLAALKELTEMEIDED